MKKSKLKKLTATNSSKQGILVLNNPTGNISFSISAQVNKLNTPTNKCSGK